MTDRIMAEGSMVADVTAVAQQIAAVAITVMADIMAIVDVVVTVGIAAAAAVAADADQDVAGEGIDSSVLSLESLVRSVQSQEDCFNISTFQHFNISTFQP